MDVRPTNPFFAIVLSSLLLAGSALAQTESVIYSFANPPDAYGPKCNLVVDAAGNMYGTTFSGGANNLGAVFKVTPAGAESVVYSFAGGADGSHPIAGLFRDKKSGNFYGTTVSGGTTNTGTVFMLTAAGTETVIYSFKGGIDGANPYASVVKVGANLFGTTYNGGAHGYGTVFKVTAAGKETVLHDFDSSFPTLDGSFPYAGLTVYKGVLYGTTTLGGTGNLGIVYSITKTGAYALLYSFKGGSADGQSPNAGVTFDKSGNLYGATYVGGADNAGVVFKLGGANGDTVLHHFARTSADGTNPYGSLIFVKGNFYGTTLQGGSANAGTVYKITPGGTETVLHAFTGGADGFNPYSALVLGGKNTFYSTTLQGGTSNLGTVFKLIP